MRTIKGMVVEIYKPADCSDCTNGGVTSKAIRAILTGDIREMDGRCNLVSVRGVVPAITTVGGDDDLYKLLPALRIEKRRILDNCTGCGDNAWGEKFWHIVAVPIDAMPMQYAFGGNFVYSCDSRFRSQISEYPVPVHDHITR